MFAPSNAYLFLELAVIAYLLGYCWEHLRLGAVRWRGLALTATSLALFWFVVDQIALRLGLWTFPAGGTLGFRLCGLPLEEYLLFLLHTLVCLALLRQYSLGQR
ncbi:MAG TPA: lycopene cyclase domain-containing protein [Thermoanaerobaculia bacterium]|nr:lycopene cyclase domain-containing protein [Thermoanaerobaculia bacterium]